MEGMCDDVLRHIVRQLPILDIYHMRKVNRKLKQIVDPEMTELNCSRPETYLTLKDIRRSGYCVTSLPYGEEIISLPENDIPSLFLFGR
jgi:hypothetical protein